MLTGGSQAFPHTFESAVDVSLQAAVMVPVCIDSSAFSYEWTVVSGTISELDPKTKNSLQLLIPGGSLQVSAVVHVAHMDCRPT